MKKSSRKNVKKICIDDVKKYIALNKQSILIMYIMMLYLLMFLHLWKLDQLIINNKLDNIPNEVYSFVTLHIASFVITFILCLITYIRTKSMMNSLCNNVLLMCTIKEQYKRFEEIKRCIETYKNESGKCDIKTNVCVIYAAIEHDMAKCIVYPILLTVATLVIPDSDNLTSMRFIIGFPMIYGMWVFACGISRNAFIKKVLDSIIEEQGYKMTK